jgi:hypothetical protein
MPVKRRRSHGRQIELILVLMAILGAGVIVLTSQYTISARSPILVRLQFPLVFAPRKEPAIAGEVRADQAGRRLTAYQQYACNKFGAACRVALAVQRAENPRGDCEIYHHNTNGTLDWGYFQINTVHLQRPGVNLRDLLDCKANIDFAYQLYVERGFDAWSTYKSGAYLQHLRRF